METAAPTADFWLCQLDFQHGDVSLLQVPLHQLVDMTNPALGVERLLCQLHPSETGKGEFSKAPTWRTLAKIAAVNTRVKRKLLEPKGPATKASATLLGWCAPHASTVRQTQDGFRAVAVAMSLHLGRLVTPRRAAACFHQPRNQSWELSEYGWSLLHRCRVSWPPHPEGAHLLPCDPEPATTALLASGHVPAPPRKQVDGAESMPGGRSDAAQMVWAFNLTPDEQQAVESMANQLHGKYMGGEHIQRGSSGAASLIVVDDCVSPDPNWSEEPYSPISDCDMTESMDTDLQAWMYCPPTSHEGIFEPMDYLLLPVDGGGSSGSETDDHDGGLSPFF